MIAVTSKKDNGAALLLVLMLIATLTAMSTAFVVRVQQTNSSGARAENGAVARCAAESGIEMAKALIRSGRATKQYKGAPTTVGDGVFVIEITPESSSRYTVTSTGRYADANVEFARITYRCVLLASGGSVSVQSFEQVRRIGGGPS